MYVRSYVTSASGSGPEISDEPDPVRFYLDVSLMRLHDYDDPIRPPGTVVYVGEAESHNTVVVWAPARLLTMTAEGPRLARAVSLMDVSLADEDGNAVCPLQSAVARSTIKLLATDGRPASNTEKAEILAMFGRRSS